MPINGAVLLATLYLAALTVKDWQEIAGVRIVSTVIPSLFLLFLWRVSCPIIVPRPVLYVVAAECFVLPAVSVFSKRAVSFYELYLPWTAMSAAISIVFFRRFVSTDLEKIGELYAKALIAVCLLSFAFTSKTTWFGAYAIASPSDFSTFFALQISLAVPFALFSGGNWVIALFMTTLWFLFSRLSFAMSVLALLLQRLRIVSLRSLVASVAVAGGAVVVAILLLQTSLGMELADKLLNTSSSLLGTGGETASTLNPSDLGRLAYIVTTIEAVTMSSFFLGHGIRTNHELIAANFDPTVWNLDDSFSQGAVHNVYLEVFSDCGVVVLLGLLALMFFIINRLRRRGRRDPIFLASVLFFLSYLFEGNYVTFFFQFFLIYFVWAASVQPDKKENGPRINLNAGSIGN